MKKILVIIAAVTVALAIYTKKAVHAQGLTEFEYTTVEKVGMLNGIPLPFEPSSVTKTYFRRKDGISGSIIKETRKGRTVTTASYRSPKDNAEVTVQVDANIRTTYPAPPEAVRNWVSFPVLDDCRRAYNASQLYGQTELSGVMVQKLRQINKSEEAEFYVAPSLGCAVLEEHHKWKDAQGAFVSWTNVELVDLKLAPPNPAYFDLGAGATEASPSEARRVIRSLLYPGEPIPDCYEKSNAKFDLMYHRRAKEAARGWVK
ncbi:MAG TPA: hypothetical protein VH601_01775 [Bryobacteraceae bacterium]|jgi:hypothetical protein